MYHSAVMFVLNKVFVTDSICSQVEKIAYGLDIVFQVISFSANGRIFYFCFICGIAHSCLFFFLNVENFIFDGEFLPCNNHTYSKI